MVFVKTKTIATINVVDAKTSVGNPKPFHSFLTNVASTFTTEAMNNQPVYNPNVSGNNKKG